MRGLPESSCGPAEVEIYLCREAWFLIGCAFFRLGFSECDPAKAFCQGGPLRLKLTETGARQLHCYIYGRYLTSSSICYLLRTICYVLLDGYREFQKLVSSLFTPTSG
jgi:hypothetical protein